MRLTFVPTLLGLLLPLALRAQNPAPATTLAVDSPAFVFSPGNWTGDAGRSGQVYRQTWYPGAYFRVTWTAASAAPTAELLLDVTAADPAIKNLPELTYVVDGLWTAGVRCASSIPIRMPAGAGAHTLMVYVKTTEQNARWGTPQESGRNVVRVTGLKVDADGKPSPAAPAKRWALIVGDSITEGNAADSGKSDNLASWSYFVGTGLQSLGYEYGLSACGYSGWLRPGDAGGDVPPYYLISGSHNGAGGNYEDARSRWNKIDARHSLLDATNHLSAYGATGQEPSAILINFGTNDGLSKVNASDLQASIAQSLRALQTAAPEAQIFVVIPFGQYAAAELTAGVAACHAANPAGRKITIIDLGPTAAKSLAANGYWSGLHPNMRGHATFAARILALVSRQLPVDGPGVPAR